MRTAADKIQDLLDYLGESSQGSTLRSCKRAILEALRLLGSICFWSYYYANSRLVTSASYGTGTIAFDLTGGAYERLVTLTTGTWPTWAAHGWLVIDSVGYEVAERISATELTLESFSRPEADVAAGKTYKIYRHHYALPADFKSGADFTLVAKNNPLTYLSPKEWHFYLARQPDNTGQPYFYTILGEGDILGSLGGMAAAFYPQPDAAYEVDFIYQRRPRALATFEYKTGTISATANSAVITGSGTTFTSGMVGSLLRAGADANNYPTDLDGSYPHQLESQIAGYTSATSLRLYSAAPLTLTGVKYIISDAIDIEPGVMQNVFDRACEKQLSELRRLKNAPEANQRFMQELEIARAADARTFHSRQVGWGRPGRLRLRNMPLGSDVS